MGDQSPVVVLGRRGQVASELSRRAAAHGFKAICYGRGDIDIGDSEAVRGAVRNDGAVAIINASAYTAVDKAESEPAQARFLNCDVPALLADICRDCGIPLLHVSTDYVHDGTKSAPYRETDPTGPLGVYGRTKLEGEEEIRSRHERHLILRTSWVFAANGTNFVKTMLRLAAARPELRIVDDQTGGPTAAADIADTLLTMLGKTMQGGRAWGTYNYSGEPVVSWCGFAREVFRQAEIPVSVIPISTSEYPTPAARPRNSVLDCTCIFETFDIAQPDWRSSLAKVLSELKEQT